MYFSRVIFFILYVNIGWFLVINCEDLDEGSECQQLGLVGICKKVKECNVAIHSLQTNGKHDLKRCGFIGASEVVCCPDYSARNPTIEVTTLDSSVIWSDDNLTYNSDKSDENAVDNKERIKTKRKSEQVCDKILIDYNIKPPIEFHIHNGEDAEVGEFPHMVALGFEDFEYEDGIDWKRCGASLISLRFLVTAAHCFVSASRPVIKKVRLGVVDVSDSANAQDIEVKNVTIHSDYNHSTKHNDIAIVELMSDVKTSKTVYPACLYTEADDPQGLWITGWGQTDATDGKSRSNILQKASIEAVPVTECNTTISSKIVGTVKTILNSQLCAISTARSDACPGDSGGPIQILRKAGGYAIVGITSFGIQCGSNVPGIYTRVSRYLSWIESVVWSD